VLSKLSHRYEYDEKRDLAPRVVCRGKGQVARAVMQNEAQKAERTPVFDNTPLARELFESCDVGDCIPIRLYQAVANCLARLYRFRMESGSDEEIIC